MVSNAKQILRKSIKESLRRLSPIEKQRQSQYVTEQLMACSAFKNSSRISVYISTNMEINTYPIIGSILEDSSKTLFVPYINSAKHSMEMVQIFSLHDFESLPTVFWDIRQPSSEDLEQRGTGSELGLDLIVVPGVAFTKNGARLGHGGGYYDSYLRKYSESFGRLPHLIAVCFKEQCLYLMAIFNFYIFNVKGDCIYYSEWKREQQTNMPQEEEFKLVYGMLFSIRSFINKLSPSDSKQGLLNFQTNKYRLNYFEPPSGLKFVMNTDCTASGIHDLLRQIYRSVFVEYVVKNPLLEPGTAITSELFAEKLDECVQRHPSF